MHSVSLALRPQDCFRLPKTGGPAMSVSCKFERSLLSHEENETVRVTHHPAIYEQDAEALQALRVRLRGAARQGADADAAEAARCPREKPSRGRACRARPSGRCTENRLCGGAETREQGIGPRSRADGPNGAMWRRPGARLRCAARQNSSRIRRPATPRMRACEPFRAGAAGQRYPRTRSAGPRRRRNARRRHASRGPSRGGDAHSSNHGAVGSRDRAGRGFDQCYYPCTARCAAKYACEQRNAGPNCFTNYNKCRSFCWRGCRH